MMTSVSYRFANVDSVAFTLQIPDGDISISSSRCCVCGDKVSYAEQMCKQCGFTFIGPFGFPKWKMWNALSEQTQNNFVSHVFFVRRNRGRLHCSGVPFLPLTKKEVEVVEMLEGDEATVFENVYGIPSRNIRDFFILL
jgi:hypothetical protein